MHCLKISFQYYYDAIYADTYLFFLFHDLHLTYCKFIIVVADRHILLVSGVMFAISLSFTYL